MTELKNKSSEDYLETILILTQRLDSVRAIDVGNFLGFKKSSVSIGLKNLKEKDYIQIDEHGYITLTNSGQEIAEEIYDRHKWFTKWLISLGVDELTASEDACKIEHALSKKSFEAIKNGVEIKDQH